MTLSTTVSRVSYPGTGSVGPFAFPFKINVETDLVVAKRSIVLPETTLSWPADFTVTGVGNATGTISLTVALAAGETLSIRRKPPNTQTTSIRNQGAYFPSTIEDEFDRLTMQIQALQDQLDRSVALSESYDPAGFNTRFAPGTTGQVVGWTSPTALGPLTVGSSVSTLPSQGRTVPSISAYLINNSVFNAKDFGAIGDGNPHPLSGFFATLAAAQAVYPHATSLTNEIDWAAIQGALNACNTAGAGNVFVPHGTCIVNQDINWPGNNIALLGEGSGYSVNTLGIPRTILKGGGGVTNLINFVQSGIQNDRSANLVQDLMVDGNLQAAYGIKSADSNVFIRVRTRGCLTAGFHLANFTNSTRLFQCAGLDNFGSGFQVVGGSTTIFTVDTCYFSNNQVHGMDIQAGVLARITNTTMESNQGCGVNIYRPNTHAGAFTGFVFDTCWFEQNGQNGAISYNNGAGLPLYSLSIDAQTRSQANAPTRIKFVNCRFAPGVATRKYLNIPCSRWTTFEDCNFAGSTAVDALNGSANTFFAAFLECASSSIAVDGLTLAQLDNLQNSGAIRSYWSDRDTKRAVQGGVGFLNAWVNFGGAYSTAAFWFDRDGNVCLSGSIKTGTINLPAFTLPLGYRPSAIKAFAVDANGAHAEVYIDATGAVVPAVGSNVLMHLNGIRFGTD